MYDVKVPDSSIVYEPLSHIDSPPFLGPESEQAQIYVSIPVSVADNVTYVILGYEGLLDEWNAKHEGGSDA